MSMASDTSPDWDRLYEVAAAQDGLFTTQQAAAVGYSSQLIAHHLAAGRMRRVRRGVYRLVHFPAGDHEDLTALWLWSSQQAVFSHQTALSLHDLSDVLPSQVYLTLPIEWDKRRLRVPERVIVTYGAIAQRERSWFGPVPATSPLRTLLDCAAADLPPELLRDAAREAVQRGIVDRDDLASVDRALEPFGGL